MKYLPIALLVALFAGLAACTEERIGPDDTPPTTEYYPLELGRSWTYQVDSIILVPELNRTRYDTVQLQARETLVDSLRDSAGRLWYRGLREERSDDGASWQPAATYALRIDEFGLYRSQDNLEFQLLAFPLQQGQNWDGHRAFDEFRPVAVGSELLDVYAGWQYSIETLDEPFTADQGMSYDRSMLVQQADVDNLIDLRRSYHRYAAGIGPVETFLDARHSQCRQCCSGNTATCLDLSWNDKAEKGIIVHQRLLTF